MKSLYYLLQGGYLNKCRKISNSYTNRTKDTNDRDSNDQNIAVNGQIDILKQGSSNLSYNDQLLDDQYIQKQTREESISYSTSDNNSQQDQIDTSCPNDTTTQLQENLLSQSTVTENQQQLSEFSAKIQTITNQHIQQDENEKIELIQKLQQQLIELTRVSVQREYKYKQLLLKNKRLNAHLQLKLQQHNKRIKEQKLQQKLQQKVNINVDIYNNDNQEIHNNPHQVLSNQQYVQYCIDDPKQVQCYIQSQSKKYPIYCNSLIRGIACIYREQVGQEINKYRQQSDQSEIPIDFKSTTSQEYINDNSQSDNTLKTSAISLNRESNYTKINYSLKGNHNNKSIQETPKQLYYKQNQFAKLRPNSSDIETSLLRKQIRYLQYILRTLSAVIHCTYCKKGDNCDNATQLVKILKRVDITSIMQGNWCFSGTRLNLIKKNDQYKQKRIKTPKRLRQNQSKNEVNLSEIAHIYDKYNTQSDTSIPRSDSILDYNQYKQID